jgi:hypothetical protein
MGSVAPPYLGANSTVHPKPTSEGSRMSEDPYGKYPWVKETSTSRLNTTNI